MRLELIDFFFQLVLTVIMFAVIYGKYIVYGYVLFVQ